MKLSPVGQTHERASSRSVAVTAPAGHRSDGTSGRVTVLHLVESLEIGGMERVLASLVRGVDRARYRARVLCLVSRGAIAEELQLAGVSVDCFEWNGAHRAAELWRLARWFRGHEVTILHTHGYAAGVLGRVAGVLARTPVTVAHLHTTDWGYAPRQRRIERALTHVTDRVICCSEAVATFAQHSLGVPLAKRSVIYNGVPLERFREPDDAQIESARRRWHLPATAPVVAIVGSLTAHKGHDVALEAVARARRTFPDLRLLVIGDGPERERLEATARSLSLESAVIFAGRQSAMADVASGLAACDLLCMPSVTREGLGLALLEAMAMGKPVVASDLEGIAEVVEVGETGWLVRPHDPVMLADGIERLLADRSRCRLMGREGRRRVEQLFDEALMVRRVTDLYDELCERARVRPRHRATILYLTCRGTLTDGGQRSLRQLVTHLDHRRFRPLVCCPERGALSERLAASGIECLTARLPRIGWGSMLTFLPTVIGLIRLIRGRRIRLIHTDAPRETLYAGIAALFFRRVRLVWHVRASNAEGADGWLVALSDRVIVVAAALRARFGMSRSPEQDEKLTVIHNGVEPVGAPMTADERTRLRQTVGAGPKTMLMAVIGRVEPLKGSETLLEALSRLPRAQHDYRLLFLGAVDPIYRNGLEVRVNVLGLADRVRFLGHQPVIEPWIDLADFIVHPSHFEAFPRAILEAMAAGKAVIASAVGGIPEAVIDGQTGLLVPSEDAAALAQAIERLITDPELRQRMGAAGRQRVKQCFSATEHARRVEAVYEKLLGTAWPEVRA